jgi:murein L,D-transpeptidase YafK
LFIHRAGKFFICLAALLMASHDLFSADSDDLWLRVNTDEKRLSVMLGRQVLQSYDNFSIGRGGTTRSKIRDDEKTPLGEYHVSRISYDSRFYLFIGLDYPSLAQAERALKAGIIGQNHYSAIRQALEQNQEPPQLTPLGGNIGIHGIGKGDKQIHDSVNWTSGCIALTDRQMDDLETWVFIGMRVVIQ